MENSRVCISIPCKGNVRAETMDWTLRAFVELAPDVEVHIVSENVPLEAARNMQAQRFLASPCTHLFLLDADCVPQQGTIQKLLAYGLPIVAAPHPTRAWTPHVRQCLSCRSGEIDVAGSLFRQRKPAIFLLSPHEPGSGPPDALRALLQTGSTISKDAKRS